MEKKLSEAVSEQGKSSYNCLDWTDPSNNQERTASTSDTCQAVRAHLTEVAIWQWRIPENIYGIKVCQQLS